jgi:hypothetical protein
MALKEAWDMSKGTQDKRERMQALSLAKECYSMITDLLTNVGVIREAMKFVTDKKRDNAMLAIKEEEPSTKDEPEPKPKPETVNKVF